MAGNGATGVNRGRHAVLLVVAWDHAELDDLTGTAAGYTSVKSLAPSNAHGGASTRYFIHRRSRTPNLWQTTQYTRYPKLGVLVDCSNHLVLGYLTDQGLKPDVRDLSPTLSPTSPHARIEWLTGDAGYDSESNHRICRDEHGIRSLIPPKNGRPTSKPATGGYRRLMQRRFDKRCYGQRWQVETVVSMMKRRLGSSLSGRSYWSGRRDLMLMVLTHNIMILSPFELIQQIKVFYRAAGLPIPTPRRW
jgi:hypothetical protein